MKRRHFLLSAAGAIVLAACNSLGIKIPLRKRDMDEEKTMEKEFEITHTKEEWQQILDREAYNVLREQGTERAFTGIYWDHKEPGVYLCAGCGNELFSSETKYESGTGWPSFWAPLTPEAIGTETDYALGMARVEVHCSRCGGHLGHVFSDGPKPTGQRYCLNSVSLDFEPEPGS